MLSAHLEQRFMTDYQLPITLTPLSGQPVSHTYTHQRWQVKLLVAELSSAADLTFYPGKWVAASTIKTLPLPKVQEKLMTRYQKQGHPAAFKQN